MTLDEFMTKAMINIPKFADLLGISPNYLSNVRNHKVRISITLANRIFRATKGLVTLEELPISKSRKISVGKKLINNPEYELVDPFTGELVKDR